MGQYWKFINVDQLQASPWLGKLGEFILNPPAFLMELLQTPQGRPGLEQLIQEATELSNKQQSEVTKRVGTGLLGQPVEILAMIFGLLKTPEDVLHLAAAHPRLLLAGVPAIKPVQKEWFPSWAGDRIMCIGDYTDIFRQGFVTEQDTKKWSALLEKGFNKERDGPNQLPMEDWPEKREELDLKPKYSPVDWRRMRMLMDLERHSEEVLVNYTHHVYVRNSVLKEANKQYKMKTTLGHVVLAKVCWSSDPSASMRLKGGLIRGQWAGHRLAIVGRENLEDIIGNGDGWRDESDRLVRMLREIWRAEQY